MNRLKRIQDRNKLTLKDYLIGLLSMFMIYGLIWLAAFLDIIYNQ